MNPKLELKQPQMFSAAPTTLTEADAYVARQMGHAPADVLAHRQRQAESAAAVGSLTPTEVAIARVFGHELADVARFKGERDRGLYTLSGATHRPCSVLLQP